VGHTPLPNFSGVAPPPRRMSPAYSQTEKSGHEEHHTVEPLFNKPPYNKVLVTNILCPSNGKMYVNNETMV